MSDELITAEVREKIATLRAALASGLDLHMSPWRREISAVLDAAEQASVLPALIEKAREEARERELMALAADQCHAGYGDEYGNHRCQEVDAAKARADELLIALKFVAPGLLVLRDMLKSAGLSGGHQKAVEMIAAVRQAMEPARTQPETQEPTP